MPQSAKRREFLTYAARMLDRAAVIGTSVALMAAGLVSGLTAPSSLAANEVVFAFTGSDQTWTVPAGVTSIEISLIGAGGAGGNGATGSTAFGGGGGVVTGTLTVVPGDTLTLIVGQGGINDNVSQPLDRNYRYGGGASGAGNTGFTNTWGSGGGRTAVRSSDPLYGTSGDVLTAGAGGGGGYNVTRAAGGAGGGTSGDSGERGDTTLGGGGGTQSAGGTAGGPSEPGVAGIQYAGGYAALSGRSTSEAGGGGGGYFGGGGGGDNGAGGGGSSYLGSTSYFVGSTTAGSGRDPGTSSWPSACGSNPGRGAEPGSSATVGEGGHGCVVISFIGFSSSTLTDVTTFSFLLPDGTECAAISPMQVEVGSMIALPDANANCRTMPGSTLLGWTIPVPAGFTGFGSSHWPFPPGLSVKVIESQRFTAVLFEPVLTFHYDANVAAADACESNVVAHPRERIADEWVPRADVSAARFPSQAACTPPGYRLTGWTSRGGGADGRDQVFTPNTSLPEGWAEESVNARTLYAVWSPA